MSHEEQAEEITRLRGWIQFLQLDENDEGLYETEGHRCVDFYKNCDMALEGKPVPTRREP